MSVPAEIVLPALLLGVGTGLALTAALLRGRSRDRDLAALLDLPYGEHEVPVGPVTDRFPARFEGTTGLVALVNRAVVRVDHRGALGRLLEQARLPIRPGEYVVIASAGALAASALLLALTGQWLYAPVGPLVSAGLALAVPRTRIARRRKALEAQLPDALGIIAGSLAAGHTFLRAVQMLAEESEAPLSEELARVVDETRLGDSVVESLDRMAERIDLRDLRWVVRAIRIQQNVGGRLAELLHTLADFIRSREELRREVQVLTAEGRISAWVLGAMPAVLLLALQVINPTYMEPMYSGWGLVALALSAGSVAGGVALIRRMVKVKV